MTTPEELASLIRFGLNELSGSNGHHEFEELVRHFTRARIATNVIPATGPVGAGGDQGRDLESFRTYLASELGPHGAFLARASEDTLAFACTLQTDGLPTKIKADVDKILASGSTVNRIYAFVAGGVPVGQRHKLQADVRDEHGIELEVFDSRAIAQELAEADIFWIAARYLSLPAEIAPPQPPEDSSEWYSELRNDWREREAANTLADLLSAKRGLRHSTFDKAARPDLPFWLALVRRFLEADFDEDLRRRARYEVSVATLRGAGDLTPADGLAAEFIDQACDAHELAELEDGSVLLMYCAGALMRSRTGLSPEQLHDWNARLRARVEHLLDESSSPNRRAMLMQILGHLSMQPDPVRIEMVDEPLPDVADMLDELEDLDVEALGEVVDVAAEDVMVDVDAGMTVWAELAATLEDAPLFPVERFADYLSILTPLIAEHPLYREIADGVDAQIEKTAGRAAAASRRRDRAIALRRADKFVAALREFHQAKVGWWSGDSLRGSLLAMFLLADCYEQLGYLHAAKHWVLVAARIAADSHDDDLQDLFAQGVSLAAHMDYGLGNWATSAGTAEAGLILHSNLVAALDFDDHRVQRMMYELLWVHTAGKDLAPDLAAKVKNLLERAHMWDVVAEMTSEMEPRSPEEWLDVAAPQLHGEFFGDVKDEVRIAFSGLGTTWTLVTGGEPEARRAIERLASAAEVLLAELASDDLALLRTDINVEVFVGATTGDRVRPVPSNEGRYWRVLLTPWTEDVDVDALQVELLAVLSSILGEVSLLQTQDFMAKIGEAFKRGLSHKIGFGPPLDALLRWIAHDEYDEVSQSTVLPPVIANARWSPNTAPELEWQDGLGPTYREVDALDAVRRRYERVSEIFSFTLSRVRESEEFRSTVEELRRRGWLDWHILNCVASAAVNHRIQALGLDRYLKDPGPKGEEARTAFQMFASEPETPSLDPVPIDAFDIDALDFNRVAGLPVFLKGVGLDVHQRTPDIPAIEHFLAMRYRYWDDDVPHDDPFT